MQNAFGKIMRGQGEGNSQEKSVLGKSLLGEAMIDKLDSKIDDVLSEEHKEGPKPSELKEEASEKVSDQEMEPEHSANDIQDLLAKKNQMNPIQKFWAQLNCCKKKK